MSIAFSDNFNRADGNTGANWTTVSTQLSIVSNQVKTNGGNNSDYWNGGTPAADCFVELKNVVAPTFPDSLGIAWRLNPSNFNGYYVGWDSGGCTIYRLDAGSPTAIGATGFTGPANGAVVRAEMRGSTISLYYDDVLQVTRTDSTYTSGNRSWILGTGTVATGDDFATGNLPTISSPTPSGTLGTQTTATVGCTTDDNTGTLYVVVDTASLSGITASQIKAGQNASSAGAVAAGNSTVSGSSPSVGVTGLSAATAYNYAVLQFSGGNSNILTGTFTTAAPPSEPALIISGSKIISFNGNLLRIG